jgi:hypothetical protein
VINQGNPILTLRGATSEREAGVDKMEVGCKEEV